MAVAIDLDCGRHAVALAREQWGDQTLKPIGPYLSALRPLEPAVNLERRWYITQVEPQQEKDVASRLDLDCKFDVFCPCEPKSVKSNSYKIGRRIRMKPMLVGYVLVGFDVEYEQARWKTIPDMRGVLRLFMIGERPLPVPDEAVERVRRREIELNSGGRMPASALPAQVGQWVQITEHPSFGGLLGLVVESIPVKWRQIVELDFFGQKVPVELDADQLRLAG